MKKDSPGNWTKYNCLTMLWIILKYKIYIVKVLYLNLLFRLTIIEIMELVILQSKVINNYCRKFKHLWMHSLLVENKIIAVVSAIVC